MDGTYAISREMRLPTLEQMKQLMKNVDKIPPRLIVCGNDKMARQIEEALQEHYGENWPRYVRIERFWCLPNGQYRMGTPPHDCPEPTREQVVAMMIVGWKPFKKRFADWAEGRK